MKSVSFVLELIDMKLIVAAIFAVLAVSAFAEDQSQWVEIDWDHVLPVQDMPGFWDGRKKKLT